MSNMRVQRKPQVTNYHHLMAQPRAFRHRRPLPHWTEALPIWVWLLVIAAWAILLYGRTLQAPFVYDDLDQIVRNPNLSTWHHVFTRFLAAPVAFTTELRSAASTGSTYRPLYWLSLAFDYHLWQLYPAGYHFTNLLLHALNGALLFHLLRRLRLATITAAAATFVWISLPINSESVAWISARAYPLCLFFLLLSLIATLRFAEKRQPLALIAAFLTAFAALLSHESGILLLPFAVLVLLLRSHGNLPSSRIKSSLSIVTTSLIAILLWTALRFVVGVHSAAGAAAPLAFAATIWKYIAWIFLPLRMSVERSTSMPPNILSSLTVLAWVALLGLVGLTLFLWKKLAATAFGLLWLLIALAPFCGLVFLYQGMAERFCYIASIGAVIAVAASIARTAQPFRTVLIVLAVLWSAWGVFRLESRLTDWTSPAALYRSSLQVTPNSPTLWFNLGFTLRESGDFSEASDAYKNSIRLNPKYQRAYSSLGETFAHMNRLDEARNAYQQALTLDPQDAGTTLNLAVVLNQSGHIEEAERQFRHVIALAPNDSAAYSDLGVLLSQTGRNEEAELVFLDAIDRNPGDPTPYSNLALLYQQTGHPALALTLYQKLLKLQPHNSGVLANIQRLQNQPSLPQRHRSRH